MDKAIDWIAVGFGLWFGELLQIVSHHRLTGSLCFRDPTEILLSPEVDRNTQAWKPTLQPDAVV